MLREGMYVRTSYNTGPYLIVEIVRNCTCPSYHDDISMDNPPPSAPHIHLRVKKPSDTPRNHPYYLGGYDEETLHSVWGKDRLYVVSPQKVFRQLLLFTTEGRALS